MSGIYGQGKGRGMGEGGAQRDFEGVPPPRAEIVRKMFSSAHPTANASFQQHLIFPSSPILSAPPRFFCKESCPKEEDGRDPELDLADTDS